MRNVSEMTPAELAHVNGHFELANKIHSMHVNLYKESSKQHVYDYIQQNNYQIPPPPRPVHLKPSGGTSGTTVFPDSISLLNNNKDHQLKSSKNKNDPYGTMRAEKKLATPPETKVDDTTKDTFAIDDPDLDEGDEVSLLHLMKQW